MMKVAVLTIGNELLNGDLVDTNTTTLARLLRSRGLTLSRALTLPDEPEAIVEGLRDTARGSELVLVTGGLGPTEDDLTIASAARFAGLELVEDEATLDHLRRLFESRRLPFTPNNARQALYPEGATVLPNAVGTAPAIRMEHDGTTFFFFPGVPRELERLAHDHLLPWLTSNALARPGASRIFRTFGHTESGIATRLEALDRDPRIGVSYRASFPEIRLGLHVQDEEPDVASELLEDHGARVRAALGDLIYSEDPDESFAAAVGRTLLEHNATVATAESCTGGLVGKLLTDVAGSSGWFLEGVVTYSNEAKQRWLDVPAELLDSSGAVSEPVARAMATGIRARTNATYGVAVTGIAGPGGGSPDKPVGTVHIAVAGPNGRVWHRRRLLRWERERNRIISAWIALDMVRLYDRRHYNT